MSKGNGGVSKASKCVSVTKKAESNEWIGRGTDRPRKCRPRPRGDERCRADETSRKGKGKGNGGKGEHGGKGDIRGKGFQRSVKVLNGEEEEDKRVKVAPNMGPGGSYPQAMADPEEEVIEEEKKGVRRMRWADCEDDEGKEEEEQEMAKERQEEAEEEKEETEQEELTSEKPPGLQANEESEHEVKEDEEQRRAQEAREDERSAQEAREEQRNAEEAPKQRMAQEEQERKTKAQEEQGKGVSAQSEREGLAREGKAQEREADAQEGHRGEMTTQEKCVEAKKEVSSMHEENDVSNRHMAWWKNAWWIRIDSGPHMRTARGRRRVWRAARRAAEQARDSDRVGETQSFAQGEERNGSKEQR